MRDYFRTVMPDCRGVGESRIYSKRVKKSPFAVFVPQSGITVFGTFVFCQQDRSFGDRKID